MNDNKWNSIKERDIREQDKVVDTHKEGSQKPGQPGQQPKPGQPQQPKQETGKKPEQQKPGKEHEKNGGCCGHCK